MEVAAPGVSESEYNEDCMFVVPDENVFEGFVEQEAATQLHNIPADSLRNLPVGESAAAAQDLSELAAVFFDDFIVCPIEGCTKVFTALSSFRKHKVMVHNLARFNCMQCSLPFKTHTNLNLHMEQCKHVIRCPKCVYVFKRVVDAFNHYTQLHRKCKCPHCGIPLQGRKMYKLHLESWHSEEDTTYFEVSSLVETALNSSFRETSQEPNGSADDHILFEDVGDPWVESPSQSSGGGCGVQLNQGNNDENARRTICFQEEVKNPNLDSITANFNVSSSGNNNYMDSDTAGAPSDPDSILKISDDYEADGGVHMLTNLFSEPNLSCPVVFGPGADELLNNTMDESVAPVSNSNTNSSQDEQWIGHDVDMFQTLSETHKKTFRFNCGRCSCKFRTKEQLKRHANTHKIVCKRCFKQFSSHPDYKNHMSTHTYFSCSVCSHKVQGLLRLMVHEMRHRLNTAFKQKMDFISKKNLNIVREPSLHECEVCKEKIEGLSFWIRHEIWHSWDAMWKSYVAGRLHEFTFTTKDKQSVEDELRVKWRDCVVNSKNPCEIPRLSKPVITKAAPSVTNCIGTVEENLCKSDKSDTDSADSESGVSTVINGWMNYWMTFLDVDTNPPSWVVPILQQLRLQWKDYDAGEHDSLYRKIDQIGVLVRAQRNKASISEGPRVLIQKLPSSHFKQQIKSKVKTACHLPASLKDTNYHTPQTSEGRFQTPTQEEKNSHYKPLIESSKGIENVLKRRKSSHDSRPSVSYVTHVSDKNQVNAVKNDLPQKVTVLTSCQPIIVLPRLVWPSQKLEEGSKNILQSPEKPISSKTPIVLLTPVTSTTIQQRLQWVKEHSGCASIPKWASTLIQDVHGKTFSEAKKLEKMHQIKYLVRAAERGGPTLMPVVQLKKLIARQ